MYSVKRILSIAFTISLICGEGLKLLGFFRQESATKTVSDSQDTKTKKYLSVKPFVLDRK